jgi:hypothetical protein
VVVSPLCLPPTRCARHDPFCWSHQSPDMLIPFLKTLLNSSTDEFKRTDISTIKDFVNTYDFSLKTSVQPTCLER